MYESKAKSIDAIWRSIMKKHFAQGKASKLRISIILILLVSLSLLTLSACNKVDVASISVVEDTVPQNVKVSDFDITKVSIVVTDADGNQSNIFASPTMLTTESRESLKTGGEKNITIMYGKKSATFTVNLFENDAELVTVTFKDKNNNIIKEITTLKGGSVTPPTHPVLDNMVADGWIDDDNDEVSFSSIDESIEVKARYAQDLPVHTVTFKDFNNVTVGTVQVEHGSRIPGAVSYTAPEGIERWEWTVGTSPLNIDSRIVNNDLIVTMTVVYIKHTVVFQFKDKNNNIVELGRERVSHKGSATSANAAITQLTQHGYNFIRWKSPFTNVQTDLNVEAEAAIFSYQVVFKDYQGTIITSQTVNHGDNAAPPANVTTRTGYIFSGEWSGGSLTNIVGNLEVTALYNPKTISITFRDGASSEIILRDYGTVITAETLGTLKQKTGNILLGLYSDAALQNIIELPYTVTSATEVYSKWIDTINGNSELQYSDADANNKRTVIGYNANDSIVYIPDRFGGADVVGIGGDVFRDKAVEKVFFGANITTIGASAFMDSKLSGSLSFPSGLTTIGASAFDGCLLTSVNIPSSVTAIGNNAFIMNKNLTAVSFGEGSTLAEIDAQVFRGCSALTSISLPASVTSIGLAAFKGSGLTSIDLGGTVETIDAAAFDNCAELTSVTGTDSLSTIGNSAFGNSGITAIALPKVTAIGAYAFENNKKLTTVSLGSALSVLNTGVFFGCSALSSVTFSTTTNGTVVTGITEIQDAAFEDCNNLKNIVLPETLTSITALAFVGALKLQAIEVASENTAFTSVDGVLFNKDMLAVIIYPAGKVSEEYIIPEDVISIMDSAFQDAIISNLTVASTVTVLAADALNSKFISVIEFLGEVPSISKDPISGRLWRLYVPAANLEEFTAVADFASAIAKPEPYVSDSFYDEASGLTYIIKDQEAVVVAADRQMTSVTVPATLGGMPVTAIEAYAFADCNNMVSIQVNANLFLLGEYAFRGCTALTNISFAAIQRAEASQSGEGSIINLNAFYDTLWYTSKNLIIISDTAFEYRDRLDEEGEVIPVTSLTIPEGVEVLDANLFDNSAAASLESIILPSTLEIIRAEAFKNTNITSIIIPNSVNTIAAGAFENAANLATITLNNSAITAISASTFKGCVSLQEIILPSLVRTIGNEAFFGCTALEKVILSSSLSSIGTSAFQNCSALPILELPARIGVGLAAGALALGDSAFAGCDSLVYLRVLNRNPALIGTDVFGANVYIYVESSDGTVINNYMAQWSEYASQIRDQKDSPVISFIANEDSERVVIPAMKNLKVESRTTAVLYSDNMSEAFKDAYPGYVFVCWLYESAPSTWVPVEYPFRTGESTTLRARWVETEEGSFSIADLVFSSALGGYILNSYNGSETRLVIPSVFGDYPIVRIGDFAFKNNDSITEIRFVPDLNGRFNLKYIGEEAFADMDRLTSIILPSSVIDIDVKAFAGCSNLEYIFIPQAVRGIGADAFDACTILDIDFEAGSELRYAEVSSFEDTAWYTEKTDAQQNFVIAGRLIIEYIKQENQNLVTLPIEAIALKAELFAGDPDLITVEFHAFIEFIGDRAFYNCSSLINLEFTNSETDPSGIKEVGVDAFTGTAWLAQQEEFVLAGTVLIKYEGKKDPDQDEFIVELPNFITIIDKSAFQYSAVEKIVFGTQSKLERIEDGAFAYCYNLEEINVPRLVTYIGRDAFYNNTSLKSVVFSGNAVKEIGEHAFFGCTALGTDIAVPQLVLPSALTELGEGAFEGCSALTNVNLQNTALTQIKSRTFFDANNLSTVIIPDSVTTLGASAFGGCTVLENITTGGNSALKEIGAGALNDTAWYNRAIPEDDEDIIIYIGNVLLDYRQKTGSNEKPNVVVPAQIKYIAARAFENSRIASISLPEGLLEIGDFAFAGCTYLNAVTIPSSVSKMGVYSFSNCQNLETVELGSGVGAIDESTFANSYNLTKVTVAKMGYGELTEEQNISVGIAIEEGTISQWLIDNPGIFVGTELINPNAFADTSAYLRIYVVRDTRDINIELYRYFWGETMATKMFNSGDVPTVSFINVPGASPIAAISTELLTEQQAYTVFKDNTLLGWEAVNSEDDPQGVPVTLPLKVIKNTTLRPVWLSNNRPANDSFLGMTYTPNASATAVVISSYNSTRDTLVIGSTVTVGGVAVPISGVNSGVFTAANTTNIKTVIFTAGGGFNMSANVFRVFANLEKFVVLGTNANFSAIDGVLYSADGSIVAAYPRARKADGEFITSYVIRSGATSIMSYAFSATMLESLTIPESIKTIGEGAFEKNFSLIAGDPTHFNGLKNIIIAAGNDLEYVAYGAFDETAWFKEMTSAFKLAGTYLLSYNGYNDKVIIPSTVKTIGVMAFKNNDLNNITQLTIPASVRKINEDAFINCGALSSIIFDTGSQLMDISNDVFNDTSWIDAMNLETSEFIVAGNVLISYKGGRDYLPLPTEIKVIGYNAFNNAQFTGITLHNSLLRIDENAFYGCDNLTSINIPASVTSIGKGAFYGCLDLNTVTFAEGSTLKTIGESAFAYSSKLTSITVPNSVEVIGNSAFEQCIALETATFGTASMLVNLGESAFKKVTALKTVFIPDGLKEIKTSTFEACQGLETINFSSNNRKLTTIGENAFKGCTALGSIITTSLLTVQLPANVTRILPGAFADCINMYGIQMQGQIVSIGLNAFSGCSKLANVTISTARPPIIEAGSFNYSVHQRLRVYVNNSVNQQVLNDYVTAWGGEKVAKSTNIFIRGAQNFPLIQFYNINRAGEEVHLTGYDMRAEFLTAAKLPSLQDSEGRGMSSGFFRSSTFESGSQVAAGANIEVVQEETPLKLYVKWAN